MTVTESAKAIAKILNVGLLGLVHEHVAWVRLRGIVAHLGDKPCFGHIEVASALVHLFAGLVCRERCPLGDHIEVGRDLQQRVQYQGPRLGDGLFHRQHTDDMITDPQMIAFGFDVGVGHLIVEELRGLRPTGNTPVVIIQQAAEKRELPLLVQDLDLHEICELSGECLHVLVEPLKIALDVCPQQLLDAVIRELRFEFGNRALWIAQQAS
ncbi:MAG: hypothetical protein WA555_19395 [Candidatus Sulfotelmatobacter sp.]